MSRQSHEVKGWATDRGWRAKCSVLFLGIVALLLVTSQATRVSSAGSYVEVTPTPTAILWKTHTSDNLDIAIRYPASWHVYTNTMQGRYSGLNPILLASFEVEFEEVGRGMGIPSGGAAILVAFEGSDHTPGQSLADYTLGHLISPYYRLTGRQLRLGQYPAVEMAGETGQLYVLGRGPNVYSAFTFAGNDPRLAAVIHEILSTLSPLQDRPVSAPQGISPLRGIEGEFVPLSEGRRGVAHPWDGPSMKMPWDRSASYRYTGGPHDWVMDWACYLAPVADACGLDFGLHYNEVLAAASGTVQWGDAGGSIGKYAIVDHGGGWSTHYLHLSEIAPSLSWGEAVSQGRVLGISGMAGTGSHLHFELRYNGSIPATWHGTAVDGYVPRMLVSVADESQGWNYQGTLTRGSESMTVVTYCDAQTYKWTGSGGTIVAGDGQPVTSTNQRRGGDPPPTATPTPTPVGAPIVSRAYLPLCLRSYRRGDPAPAPTATATPPTCVGGMVNGGFERDGAWEIPTTQYPADYTTAIVHSGDRSMRVGIVEPGDNVESYSSARQVVAIPAEASSASLRFRLYPLSEEPLTGLAFSGPPVARTLEEAASSGDAQYVLILDEHDQWIGTVLWQRSDDRWWASYQYDLITYAGQSIKLHLGVYNDGVDGVTGMYVDDVSLELCSASAQAR